VRVRVYSTTFCAYCTLAKRLLEKRAIAFEEIDVSGDHEARSWLVKATGRRTVPQIFIDDDPIGGYNELAQLDRSGELVRRLSKPVPAA
jgi:glutaredoxin 3